MKGFHLADKYRMTAMILADGTIGQMMEPISFEDAEVETYEKPWALTGTGMKRPHHKSFYLVRGSPQRGRRERPERNWPDKPHLQALLPGFRHGVFRYPGRDAECYHAYLRVLRRPVSLCNRTGGMIPSPQQVLEAIREALRKWRC